MSVEFADGWWKGERDECRRSRGSLEVVALRNDAAARGLRL